jgi:putative endonuclease
MRGERTSARGWRAERLAAAELERRGYAIVRFNYRAAGGEIDLIARELATLCFVEVRSRRTAVYGHPLETIDRRKRRRLIAAARQYLASMAHSQLPVRFDVVSLVYRPVLEVRLVRGAFTSTDI